MPPQQRLTAEVVPPQGLTVELVRPDGLQSETARPEPKGFGATIAERSGLSGLYEFGKGAAKGLASTAIGAAELVNKGASSLGLTEAIDPAVFDAARGDVTPTGPAQSAGFGAEQIAEFLVPIGGPALAAKVASRAPQGLRTAARLGAEMAVEGAELGGKTAVQTGGEADDIVTAALLGAAAPPLVKTAQAVGRVAGDLLPERLYTQIFSVLEDDWRAAVQAQAKGHPVNPTLAREILNRGLRGNSKNLAVASIRKLDGLEREVQSLVSQGMPPVQVPKKKELVGLLDFVRRQFGKGFFSERAGQAARLSANIKAAPGNTLRPKDALEVKRFLDQMRNTSSFRLDPRLTARQEELKLAADMVRTSLKTDPKFATLMDEERIMIQGLDAIVSDAVRRQNKKLIGLTDYLLGGGGMAAGWGISGIGAAGAVRGFQQPFTLTNLGYGLDRLYKAVPKGATEAAGKLGVRAATAGGGS